MHTGVEARACMGFSSHNASAICGRQLHAHLHVRAPLLRSPIAGFANMLFIHFTCLFLEIKAPCVSRASHFLKCLCLQPLRAQGRGARNEKRFVSIFQLESLRRPIRTLVVVALKSKVRETRDSEGMNGRASERTNERCVVWRSGGLECIWRN